MVSDELTPAKANDAEQMRRNWRIINDKVMSRLGMTLVEEDVSDVIAGRLDEKVERVLLRAWQLAINLVDDDPLVLDSPKPMWGFLGVPRIRILGFWGLY